MAGTPAPRRRLPRMRMALWFLVAAVLALLILVIVVGRSEVEQVGEGTAYGTSFQLVDQNNQPITEAAVRERPTAMFFGFTHCPEVCPTTLYELSGYQKELAAKGENFKIVFVSVDPERDTPDILKTYVGSLSSDITAITGDPTALTKMLGGWGIYAKKVGEGDDYTMDHTASVLLLKPGGELLGTIAYGEDPDAAKAKLERLAAFQS